MFEPVEDLDRQVAPTLQHCIFILLAPTGTLSSCTHSAQQVMRSAIPRCERVRHLFARVKALPIGPITMLFHGQPVSRGPATEG